MLLPRPLPFQGHYSTVYLAEWSAENCKVAVKIPTMKEHNVEDVKKDLMREILTMSTLNHPHIVRLLGISDSECSETLCMIVTPCCNEVALVEFLGERWWIRQIFTVGFFSANSVYFHVCVQVGVGVYIIEL